MDPVETQMTESQEETGPELMTPEEMALLKKLQEKRKAQQKAMGGVKDDLFQTLTKGFGKDVYKAKKDVVTISTKDPYTDGNIYAITFGVEEEDSDVDQKALVASILEGSMNTIDAIMGISNSIKVSGTYEGKKLFWQIRKRPHAD